MRVQLLSDVHTEFFSDRGERLIRSLDPSGVDVLVLAGDVGTSHTVAQALRRFCERYEDATVLYVLGNHEWYGDTMPVGAIDEVQDVADDVPNLRFLDDDVLVVDGVVFAGSTLWFRDDPLNVLHERSLADFHHIGRFREHVYGMNAWSEQFLRGVLAERGERRVDVVVTHHLPSVRCVAPQYKRDPLTRFFVAPVADALPAEDLPQVWAYGHTHTPLDEVHDGCRFVCNPFGYPHESKRGFREKLVFDVQHRG